MRNAARTGILFGAALLLGGTCLSQSAQAAASCGTSRKLDVLFLADNTGSMAAPIASVQARANSILRAISGDDTRFDPLDVRFGVARYLHDPSEGAQEYCRNSGGCGDRGVTVSMPPYLLLQSMTNSRSAGVDALNQWQAFIGGGDWPEGQFYGFQQLVGSSTGWRGDAGHVLIWMGDAPGHTETVTVAQATAALQTQNMFTIALTVVSAEGTTDEYGNPIPFDSMDSSGQATSIVNATGGVVADISSMSDGQLADLIVNKIYEGYEENCASPPSTSPPPTPPPPPAAGACATFSSTYTSQPADSSNGCTSGTYSELGDDNIDTVYPGVWRWQCGTTTCTAAMKQCAAGWAEEPFESTFDGWVGEGPTWCNNAGRCLTSTTPGGHAPSSNGGIHSCCSRSTSTIAWTRNCFGGSPPPPPPTATADCALPWGGTLAHGATIQAFRNGSAACGDTCQSEIRSCWNGSLSGSYTNQSCSVAACPPPTSCSSLPWAGTLSSGQKVTAYRTASAPCGGSCDSQERVCNNATLSGTYTYQSCVVDTCPPDPCPATVLTWTVSGKTCRQAVGQTALDTTINLRDRVYGEGGDANDGQGVGNFRCDSAGHWQQLSSTCVGGQSCEAPVAPECP